MEDQYDLVIDAGNTRTKFGWFNGGRLVRWTSVDVLDAEAVNGQLNVLRPKCAVIGSGRAAVSILKALEGKTEIFRITGTTPVPIRNSYSTPATLGVDRLANAVAAAKIFPARPVLVIDAGTCITYDLIEADGTFIGGAISPGKKLRALAMHRSNAALPLVEDLDSPQLVGRSTMDSLASGVHHGMIAEMQGMIAQFRHERAELAVMLTGGDALGSCRALKSGIFAHPILTLVGLHAILVHNRDAHGFDGHSDHHRGKGTRPAG
ncbi:MAG: type III pantothenate kinase [Bacteroidota bacterium]|nr:type III pantothenate kinase [Bacteroidota bacterium]